MIARVGPFDLPGDFLALGWPWDRGGRGPAALTVSSPEKSLATEVLLKFIGHMVAPWPFRGASR